MYQSLYQRVMDEVTADRLSSPYTCFALEADEGTDSSNTSILIIYIRYMSGQSGEVYTTFLAVRELPGTTAGDIFCVMRQTMVDYNLLISNFVGIAVDGVSVMIGVKTGLTTRFKEGCPWLLANHCMAHCLQSVFCILYCLANEISFITGKEWEGFN